MPSMREFDDVRIDFCHTSRINFLRLNILKVFQLSEKHITKITSVDEFLRRIFSVIHSNDPVARAVTLRYMYSRYRYMYAHTAH
jgi:hypothetical protein